MTIHKDYFYIPENRELAVVSTFIPVDGWNLIEGYLITVNTTDGILELEFASRKGVDLLLEALTELMNNTGQKNISIKNFIKD